MAQKKFWAILILLLEAPRTCPVRIAWRTILVYLNTQKRYFCLNKRKLHNKREIFKTEILLEYQWANLNFDISVLIFCCHLAEIRASKVNKRFENCPKCAKNGLSMWEKNRIRDTPHLVLVRAWNKSELGFNCSLCFQLLERVKNKLARDAPNLILERAWNKSWFGIG